MANTKAKEAWWVCIWNWTLRYPLACLISLGVLCIAVLLALFGVGDGFNVGGIIGKLFGKSPQADTKLEVQVNEVPKKRVDLKNIPIPLGKADGEGFVQQPVEVVRRSKNIFRDTSKLEVVLPDGERKKLVLPTGVKDTDVATVILTKPSRVKILVHHTPPGVTDALLNALREGE